MSRPTLHAVSATAEGTELPTGAYHHLLSSRRRQRVIEVLSENDCPLSLTCLAAAIRELETAREEPDEQRQVAVTLHHIHLPRMDELGVLEYDHEARRVQSFSFDG